MMDTCAGDRKSERFELRLTRKQLDMLKAKARVAGMTASDFVVACAVDGKTEFALARIPASRAERVSEKRHDGGGRWRQTNKDVSFKLRMTEREYERLDIYARRAGISKAEYIRRLLAGDPIVVIDRHQFATALGELNKQGGNLNQIARKVNALSAIAWRDDVDGSAIDSLVYELEADNKRTRTAINDAAVAVRDLAINARRSFRSAADGDD